MGVLKGVYLVLLAAMAAFLVLSVSALGQAGQMTILAMHLEGWSTYLGVSPAQPLRWLVWCLSDERCKWSYMRSLWRNYPKWPLVGFGVSLVGAAVARLVLDTAREKAKVLPGAARWATEKEVRHLVRGDGTGPLRGYAGVLAPARRPLLRTVEPVMLRLPERIRCGHCLVVGGPGARKSTGYHKMNLIVDAVDRVSAVVFDIKYPDPVSGFLDVVPYFITRGFDVQLFLPFEEESLSLPLLGGVRTREDAYDLVDVVRPLPEREHAGTWFTLQERELLAALILGAATDHMRRPDDPYRGAPSLGRLYWICKGGLREVERYIHSHPNPEVRRLAEGLFDLREDTLAGTIAGVAGVLHVFGDPLVDRNTMPRGDPREEVILSRIGEKPTLLYIGVPQEKIQGMRGQVLLQLVKRVIDRELLRTADRHGGVCPVHVSVYMDEFRAMGPLPNISENLATMRSRRVAYHMSLQNRAQGEELYGVSGFRSFFVNNAATVIIFPRYLRFDDARYFSETLGYMTTEQRSTGFTKRMFQLLSGSRTDWVRDVLRPLVPPEEYPDWGEAQGIVFTTGCRPIRALFPRLDEDAVYGVRNPFIFARKTVFTYTRLFRDEAERRKIIRRLLDYHGWLIGKEMGLPRGGAERQAVPGGQGQAAPAAPPEAPVPVPGDAAGQATHPAEPPGVGASRERPAAAGEVLSGVAPAAAAGDGEAAGRLMEWVAAVASLQLPDGAVRAYLHNRRLTKVSILRSVLPEDLSAPSGLLEWMARGWVKVTPSEISLLPPGFRLVDREHLAVLRRAGIRRSGEQVGLPGVPQAGQGGAGSDAAGGAGDVAAASGVSWARMEGREETGGAAVSEAPERPEGGEEAGAGGDLCEAGLRAVAEWIGRNAQRLVGHPERDEGVEPAGVWREGEWVALVPQAVTEALVEAGIPEERHAEVRAAWVERGYVEAEGVHIAARMVVGGVRRRVVRFRWEAVAGRRASA